MPKCNHTSTCVFSFNLAVYFQNTFSSDHLETTASNFAICEGMNTIVCDNNTV